MKRAKVELLKKIHGGQTCQIVSTATRLGLFEVFSKSPLSLEALSQKTGLQKTPLQRLCSALVALYLLKEPSPGHFAVTEQGTYLQEAHPDSLKEIAIYKGSPLAWKPLGFLYEGMKTGRSPFHLCFGQDLFTYLQDHENDLLIFQKAMSCYVKQGSSQILDLYPFQEIRSLIDLGGGLGDFLKILHEKYPHLSLSLFEMPQVLRIVQSLCPHPPFHLIAGNFFEKVPAGFDAYLMRNILHDWSDDDCLKILQKIRNALTTTSRLLILETLVDEESSSRLGRFADLTMFVQTNGGKERSETAWKQLFHGAKLKLHQILKTNGSKAILDVRLR